MRLIVIMLFRIKLSSPETVAQINQRLADGRAIRVPVQLRNVELEILDACYNALAKQAIYLSEYLQCIKHMETIQSSPITVSHVTFSKSDLENLLKGFSLTKGERPDSWTRCIEFFKQIDAPEQIDDIIPPTNTVQTEPDSKSFVVENASGRS